MEMLQPPSKVTGVPQTRTAETKYINERGIK
jgi:hypothetical protein